MSWASIPLELQRPACPFCGLPHVDGYGRTLVPGTHRRWKRGEPHEPGYTDVFIPRVREGNER